MAEERLLVIDDDASLREFLPMLLERDGYQIETAASGEEGLEVYNRWHPDLVITDLRMEPMDGVALLRELQARYPGLTPTSVTFIPAKLSDNQILMTKDPGYLARLQAHAAARPRFGYRRLHILLDREGVAVNHKRVYRVYRAAGLQVRRRRRKR